MARLESSSFGEILKKILIIGAGWAGLSAAVQATKRGAKVTLLEASNELGGRARSVQMNGHALDNGQHILIGAYRATLSLMASVGLVPQKLLLRQRLDLRDINGSGFRLLGPKLLPPSLQFLLGLIYCKPWSIKDKYSLIRTAAKWYLSGFNCDALASVKEICSELSQPVIDTLITPLCLSAFNTPPYMTSGQVFLRVLNDSMFCGAGGSDFLIPRCDLGKLFPKACERWLVQRGCEIHKNKRVESLNFEYFSNEPLDTPDAIIVACDATNAARLIKSINPAWAACAERLEFTQIATTYLRCNDPSYKGLTRPLLMLHSDSEKTSHVDRPAQFVFDRARLFEELEEPSTTKSNKGVLSFVSSFANLPNEAITSAVLAQATKELKLCELEILGTITERRATFCCKPALIRPPQSVVEQIWACGDYIEGPYPSTLEGAVISGEQVIQRVLESFVEH